MKFLLALVILIGGIFSISDSRSASTSGTLLPCSPNGKVGQMACGPDTFQTNALTIVQAPNLIGTFSSTSYFSFVGVTVAPNGKVTCRRVKQKQLDSSGTKGIYFALCGHRRKIK